MNTRFKKLLMAVVVGTAVASLAACGGGGSSNNNAATAASDTSASAPATSALPQSTAGFAVTTPIANATLSGNTQVTGTADDTWTTVSVLDSTTGAKLTDDVPAASGKFSARVDTTKLADGHYVFRFVASNKNNAKTATANVNVVVSNGKTTSTPVVTPTTPTSTATAPSATTTPANSAPATPASTPAAAGTTTPTTTVTPTPSTDTTGAAPVTTPTTNTPTAASIFYGVNGHATEGGAYDISSDTLQLQQLQDLGAKIYRNEVIGTNGAQRVATRAKIMAAGGIQMDPVMLMGTADVSSETDGYNQGMALGKATAQAYAFPYIEVTNEIEAECLVGNVDGVNSTDYDTTCFQKARGIIRGMIAGAKAVNPNVKIIMGGGAWLHYGFYQMLYNGTQPDGTSGQTKVDWDITAWHWYSDQGDIESANGGTGNHNVLATLQSSFGKPIWLNEYGVRPSLGNDTQVSQYLVGNQMMAEFVKDAAKYNITSIQFYELYDDPAGGEGNYGLLKNDGKTAKAQYTAFKNFISANPM